MTLRGILGSASLLAMLAAGAARAETAAAETGTQLEELIVTAQKRAEVLQDVPIAVSAFSGDALAAKKIDGGSGLLQAIPNVNFSKANFRDTYNFQIRGIGLKLIGVTADGGVSIHENYSPVGGGNLADAEFYDVERVEVLRGPQGTLYGRNATGGAVNMITNKPLLGELAGSLTGEYGSYDARKLKGFLNVPLGDKAALRIAGSALRRDGFGDNLYNGHNIDGRDIYGSRVSLRYEPTSTLRLDLMWEHFNEDDNRARSNKQLCAKDTGPTSVGGVAIAGYATPGSRGNLVQGFLSQGCLNVPLRDPRSLGTVDSRATLPGLLANINGLIPGDAYAGVTQTSNLYDIAAVNDPYYRTRNDFFQVNLAWNVTEQLTLTSTTGLSKNKNAIGQDLSRTVGSVPFNTLTPLATATGPLTIPRVTGGNVFNDPQVGSANSLAGLEIGDQRSHTMSQEIRLQSNFDGPLNFNVGAVYYRYKAEPTDTYYISNAFTLAALIGNLRGNPGGGGNGPTPIDYANPPGHSGHNYFNTYQPNYRLTSKSVFGELYWKPTETVKITAGVRYNDDDKYLENTSQQLLTPIPPGLVDQGPVIPQRASWKVATGRLGVDWKVTPDNLVYAFYSRGYKPGGINPPSSVGAGLVPLQYKEERVDAFEVGTKNTLLDGRLTANLTGFYYDYGGYQIAKLQLRQAVNENIDTKVWGVEFESVWAPVRDLKLNASLGYLHTEIAGGTSVDTMNRTQGDPRFVFIKGAGAAGCIAPTDVVARLVNLINTTATPPGALLQFCPSLASPGGAYASSNPAVNPLAAFGIVSDARTLPGRGDGVAVSLKGRRLPNSPEWTVSLGAEYSFHLAGGWDLTPRVDYYWQAHSFSRIYNDPVDRLNAYALTNVTVRLQNRESGWQIAGFIKNAFDKTAIQDGYTTDDALGLYTNVFVTDPRQYGISITKSF